MTIDKTKLAEALDWAYPRMVMTDWGKSAEDQNFSILKQASTEYLAILSGDKVVVPKTANVLMHNAGCISKPAQLLVSEEGIVYLKPAEIDPSAIYKAMIAQGEK